MKVAVITGAASGIGLALSRVYLEQGAKVVLIDKDGDKLAAQAKSLQPNFCQQIQVITADVTKAAELSKAALNISRIDWLYNNAGIIGELGPVWELKPEDLRLVMEVNLFGMINVIQAFMPQLLQQDFRSQIINIASLYALCSGSQVAAYSMSKHAVLALSESLHFDLQRLNKPIDISVVFPSFTDTSLLSKPDASGLHASLGSLLSHSRPAEDVARHIVLAAEQRQFYIFPDQEVKTYCEERTRAMVLQEEPHRNAVEGLMRGLIQRLR